jgi:hypothetical protein
MFCLSYILLLDLITDLKSSGVYISCFIKNSFSSKINPFFDIAFFLKFLILFSNGADKTLKNDMGRDVLEMAKFKNRVEIIEILTKN